MGIGNLFREGAMDLLGVGEELDELREAAESGRMLARKIEDINFGDLLREGAQSNYFDPDRGDQVKQTDRAYRFFFNDPIIKRTVMLRSYYTWGRGVATPTYREDLDADRSEEILATGYINRFWEDEENKAALTSYAVQLQRDIELQLQANIFLLLFYGSERAPESLGEEDALGYAFSDNGSLKPSSLKVSDVPEREVVDVLMHPENDKIPVFYKRQFRRRYYDFDGNGGLGAWKTEDQPTVRYYRHWKHEAPTERRDAKTGKMVPWGPRPEQVAEGAIYHVAVNKTPAMKFGISELQTSLKWAKGLQQYMTARMATVQAIAQLAMRAKTRGGQKNVQQLGAQLTDLMRHAGAASDGLAYDRTPADSSRTKIAVENEAARLEPMIQDTNASNAQGDISIMKGQVAAGSGVGEHHLGGPGQATLSGATSMDAPLLRMIQANQKLWQEVLRDITGEMLDRVGLDKARLDVQMPPILERDVGNVVAYLTNLQSVEDPQISSNAMRRFVVSEVLDAMGKTNTKEILDALFPVDAQTPYEQNLALANAQAGGGEAPPGTPDPDAATTPAQRAASRQDNADKASEVLANGGRRRGPTAPGGPESYGRASRNRASERRDRAVSEGEIQEANDTLHDMLQAEARSLFDEMNFPPELLEAAESAMARFDDATITG